MTAAHIDPLGYLYQKPNAIPFADYAPESEFSLRQRVVVARLSAVNNSIYNAVIIETRVPTVIMQGHVYNDNGPLLRISTGTTAEIIPLLYGLSKGFSDGSVVLDPTNEHVVKVRMWEVGENKSVCFGESSMVLPDDARAVTMYFKDVQLAKGVAQQMLADMLGVRWFTT